MAPLHSAILPISTHIDEATDTRRLQMLGRNGLVLPGAIIVPVLIVVALFSEEILKVWVGPQHSESVALARSLDAGSRDNGDAGCGANGIDGEVRFSSLQYAAALFAGHPAISDNRAHSRLVSRAGVHSGVGALLRRLCAADRPSHAFADETSTLACFGDSSEGTCSLRRYLRALVAVSKMFFDPGSLDSPRRSSAGLAALSPGCLSGAIILSGSDRAMFGRFARAMTPRS